jgi:hypothetical protein
VSDVIVVLCRLESNHRTQHEIAWEVRSITRHDQQSLGNRKCCRVNMLKLRESSESWLWRSLLATCEDMSTTRACIRVEACCRRFSGQRTTGLYGNGHDSRKGYSLRSKDRVQYNDHLSLCMQYVSQPISTTLPKRLLKCMCLADSSRQ